MIRLIIRLFFGLCMLCLSVEAKISLINLKFTEEGYWYAKGYNNDPMFPKDICWESCCDCDLFSNPSELFCFFRSRLRKDHPVLRKLKFWKYVRKHRLQVDVKEKELIDEDIKELQKHLRRYKRYFEKIAEFFGINKSVYLDIFYSRINSGAKTVVNACLDNYIFKDEIHTQILANELPLNDPRMSVSSRLSILAHEFSHAMLSAKFGSPEKFENIVSEIDEPNSYIVSGILNEALAAVLGNIVVQEKISGEKVDWRKEEYCTYGFANALKELTNRYLNNSRAIDEHYIREAIKIFNKIFPNCCTDPRFFLRNFILIGPRDVSQKASYLMSKTVSGSYEYFSFPVHKFSEKEEKAITNSHQTLIITYSNDKELQKVRKFIPTFDERKNINLISRSNRIYLILKVDKNHSFEELVDTLLSKKDNYSHKVLA